MKRTNVHSFNYSDGNLTLACGKVTLQAKASIANCDGTSCSLTGWITDGPDHITGRNIRLISHDCVSGTLSVERRSA